MKYTLDNAIYWARDMEGLAVKDNSVLKICSENRRLSLLHMRRDSADHLSMKLNMHNVLTDNIEETCIHLMSLPH